MMRRHVIAGVTPGLFAVMLAGGVWQQSARQIVAADVAGPPQARPHLLYGGIYEYPADAPGGAAEQQRSVMFGPEIALGYGGLNPNADYELRLTFLSDGVRDLRVFADDIVILDRLSLTPGRRRLETIAVPRAALADGRLILRVTRTKGPNAVVSSVEVLSSDPTPLSILPEPELPAFTMPQLSPAPERVAGVTSPILSLDGAWRFHPAPPELFHRLAQAGEGWGHIEVPGQWVQQGYTVDKGRAAGYWRTFQLPPDWRGKTVKLRSDGVFSKALVFVNGREAGSHLGGMTPFELDVSPLVTDGTNTVALAVTSDSLADTLGSLNQYAAHDLGGIPRSMSLVALPRVNIASFHVETTFDAGYRDAVLRVLARVARDDGAASSKLALRLRLAAWPSGVPVRLDVARFPVPGTGDQVFEIPVRSPRKWDPEHPNLYSLSADLERDGVVLETATRRIGFRDVRVLGNEVYVNGQPIKLHGVTRHEVDPVRGRSLTREDWKRDAELFRAANVNYIRTSHYPPAEPFIELCDELGIFVEEEAPVCWVGHAANPTWRAENPYDPASFEYLRQAVLEMIQRDRSHPSVIIWSLANESAWGPLWHQVNRTAALADPTRPRTFHDQAWGGDNNFGSGEMPIANFHYPGPPGPAQGLRTTRPLLFGEYCHLNAYNRFELVTDPSVRDGWGRGLERMWEAMYNSKGILGGALWSGIDDSFFLPNGQVVGYGAWGPIDGWRREKPEYWHVKKVYSPVKVSAASFRLENRELQLLVENRHDFSNLNEIDIRWSTKNGAGQIRADVPPRSKGTLRVPVADSAAADTLRLEFHSPRGFLIDIYDFSLAPRAAPPPAPAPAPDAAVSFSRSASQIAVRGSGFTCDLDARSGQILRAVRDGREWLSGGPELLLLPLNGEGGTQMTGANQVFAPFTATCTNWRADVVAPSVTGDTVQVYVKGSCDDAEGDYWLRFDPSGRLEMSYSFMSRIDVNPRQVGMVVTLPRTFAELSWKRRGQWTAYPADHIGRLEGTAPAFPVAGLVGPVGPSSRPTWPWAHDTTELGSSDFRSTKENIDWASLRSPVGDQVSVVSNGRQHVRAWVDRDRIRLLVAFHNTPGAEGFFRSHASVEDRPLKPGFLVADTIRLEPGRAR